MRWRHLSEIDFWSESLFGIVNRF